MIELLSLLVGFAKNFFEGQQKLQQAKQEREQAAIATQIKLIQDENSNNSAWEIASLAGKDKWLQRISFAMFSFPLVWAAFDPNAVANYFKVAIAACPTWYFQTYITMTGVVWSVASLKNSAPAMIGGIKAVWKNWKDPDQQ